MFSLRYFAYSLWIHENDLMKALILAGGKGTRLQHLTQDVPKPMIPILSKPILEYQIKLLKENNILDIVLIVNHLGNTIKDYFKNGSDYGVNISYYEEEEPLGTVGGVKALADELNEDFLVLYGDVMVYMDLDRLITFHKEKASEATLVVHPNDHPQDSDLLEMDEDSKVIAFHPKPHESGVYFHNMVNAALYLFSPKVLEYLPEGKSDFGKDIFPFLHKEIDVYAYNTTEYLKDMGTLDRLEQVSADVQSGKLERRSLKNKQKAIFLDRDGVINPDYDLIHKTEDMELYPWSARAIKRINKSDFLSVVTTNQSIIARNLTNIKGLGEIHKKMESLLGMEGAKLDDIYFCPHHPDGGFPGENPAYKMICECRKPKAGMHLKAAKKFNIDLSQSYMIGDSERDTGAAQAAGCTSVGVRTGHGHKTSKLKPDFMFDNLEQAVNYILDEPLKGIVEEVSERIISRNYKCISIGGNSRSGKSNFAKSLEIALKQKGIKALILSLDYWIKPKNERKSDDRITDTFQFPKLLSALTDLIKGKTIEIVDGYQAHPKQSLKNLSVSLDKYDLLIIEGVPALEPDINNFSDYKIYSFVDEKIRKERFQSFYRWKGLGEKEIEDLYQERLNTEVSYINRHEIYADLVIS